MNYVTRIYHTIIMKKYQYNYDTISIIFEYKYRQINTNKYSILTNKNSLTKSLNNAKYELHELLNKLYSEKERLNTNFVHILKLLRTIR